MQTLGLGKDTSNTTVDASAPYVGFWKRQFQHEQTSAQRIFDLSFGIVLPALCFFLDPIVFKTSKFGITSLNIGSTLFGQYRPFAYLFTFAAIMAMTGWLLRIESLRPFSAAFGGLFAIGGATTALIIGVILFPFSLLGLIMIIGVLGFVPLFTAFVYLRNSVIALRIAREAHERSSVVYAGALTALFSIVIPYVANVQINRKLEKVLRGNATTVNGDVNGLKWLAPLVNSDKFVEAFRGSRSDEKKKEALENAFQQITGEDLSTAAENSCPGC